MESFDRRAKRRRTDHDPEEEYIGSSTKRTSRACDLCRTKKNKCDGQRPVCSTCARGGLECTYGVQAKKRGFPTGYVRVLEALWALAFKAIPEGEQTTLTLLKDSTIGHDDDEKVILRSSHFDNESPRTIWEKSSVRAEIERMVSSLETSAGMDLHELSSHHLGIAKPAAPPPIWSIRQVPVSSDASFSTPSTERAIISVPNDPKFHNARSRLLNLSPEYVELGTNMPTTQSDPMSLVGLDVEGRPNLPIDVWALVDVYFRFNNCWLPIIPKHDVVRILSSYLDGSACSTREVALLWAILAIASVQSEASQDTNLDKSSEDRSTWYYRQALDSLPRQHEEFYCEQVQALLLLTMFDMARDLWESSYMLVGRAIRVLLLWHANVTDDANRSAANDLLSPESACLLLAAFALDTIIATHLKVLPHLRAHDIQRYLEFDDSGAEEWSQWSTANTAGSVQDYRPVRALSTFKVYVKLLTTLNDVCCSMHSTTLRSGRTNVDQCLRNLERWRAQLPKHCRIDIISTNSPTTQAYLPSVTNLYLTFEAVVAYVHSIGNPSLRATTAPQEVPATVEDSQPRWLYGEVFGRFKWNGILYFHSRMLMAAHHNQSITQSIGVETFGLNGQNLANSGQIDLGLTQQAISLRHIGASSTVLSPISMRKNLVQDFAPDRELPYATIAGPLEDSANYEPMQTSLTFPLPTQGVPQDDSMEQMTNPPMHGIGASLYDEGFETDTIESLLEELSATQGSDWNEISSQFRYNLGFTDNDIGLP